MSVQFALKIFDIWIFSAFFKQSKKNKGWTDKVISNNGLLIKMTWRIN